MSKIMNNAMRNAKRRIILMIILFMPAIGCLASKDFNVGVNYTGSYSDNVFFNGSNVSDFISQFQAEINYSVDRFAFFLDASTGIFTDNPEYNSFHLEPGIEYLHYLKGRNSLFLSLRYERLQYKELYTDFNYGGPRFQAYIKIYLSPRSLFKGGYRFDARNYSNYESFDFNRHNLFVEYQYFFKTQTTLQLTGGFHYRYYPHIIEGYDFGEGYNYYQQGLKGNAGSGKMNNKSPGGHGPGAGGNIRSMDLSIPNIYGILKLSQSIGVRVGINGEVEWRHHFRGLEDAETLIKNAYAVYPENDDYLWDGKRFSLEFKTVLLKSISLRGRFSYYDKDYQGVFIMDDDGNVVEPVTQRQDSLYRYTADLSGKIRKLDFSARFDYRDNRSSDTYFSTKVFSVTLGIGYYF